MSGDSTRPLGHQEKIGIPTASDQSPGDLALAGADRFDIRIARDGSWFYRGSRIDREPLVRLFSSVLRRGEAGEYWLVTPVERGRILVEDAPFTAVELARQGEGSEQILDFRNNVGDWVAAGPEHPIRVALDPDSEEPSPYILVRDGLEALIVRSVFYELVDLAVERRREDGLELGVWSRGTFFRLGELP